MASYADLSSGSLVNRCDGSYFSNLDVFGAQVLNINANPVNNFATTTAEVEGRSINGTWNNLNFCNVTVTYTHPARNDEINVFVLLPFDDWNGRFLGAGGGGWITGYPWDAVAANTADGWAVASTDGGHSHYASSAADWILDSPGNVNINELQNFASVALNDISVIGKHITATFYGTKPKKSYWSGCSTGGRQGLMLAQRYPDAFDGILAIAPAINWARFLVAMYWGQQVMSELEFYPPECELDAITQMAVEACDEIDGLKDGIISSPGLCEFDARTLIGRRFDCNGQSKSFSEEAAGIVNAVWQGPKSKDARYGWFGFNIGTNLTSGTVGTKCEAGSITPCTGSFGFEHIKYLVLKSPNANLRNLTNDQYFSILHRSTQEYTSIIDTSDPDLSQFKHHGGKMLTWHGLADQLIMPNGSSDYYKRVLDIDSHAPDFYRYFEVPGVAHCTGGSGPLPTGSLDAVIKWVEEGIAPETLLAKSQTEIEMERRVCSWPKQQIYVGGDGKGVKSFECR
ncbi:hypothetical protein DOTSEDRAFT_126881 [Dothistroma septosporum NZE10]|uniref:Carboxylic ester hydrolase n=1 Tax=Dothistroma septosporum (strain NZE10 / CBS 128990) TaxID=675120 RepID=N1PXB4_DOTSN|nr:hypothetical protein DOTSEDRAFT_126881 [Dothistroma septosporum NZE10]